MLFLFSYFFGPRQIISCFEICEQWMNATKRMESIKTYKSDIFVGVKKENVKIR